MVNKTKADWFDIEHKCDKMRRFICKQIEPINDKEYRQVFDLYVSPYFKTWDNFAACCNNDRGYMPALFCMYAQRIGITPTKPLFIMRAVLAHIEHQLTNQETVLKT